MPSRNGVHDLCRQGKLSRNVELEGNHGSDYAPKEAPQGGGEIAEIAKVDFFGALRGIGMTPSGAPLPTK